MNEKDIICQYAKELKLATVRENLSLFVEDAMREQWGYLMFLRRLFEEEEKPPFFRYNLRFRTYVYFCFVFILSAKVHIFPEPKNKGLVNLY